MVRDTYAETSASCLNCERLNDCMLKNDILSEEIKVPDFAKEGCLKYQGEGEQKLFLPKEDVLKAIKQAPIFRSDLRELGLNEKRLLLTFEELGLKVKEDADKWVFLSRKRIRKTPRKHRGTPIFMCNKEGVIIRKFNKVVDACKFMRVDNKFNILRSAREGCLAYGYLWIREKEY